MILVDTSVWIDHLRTGDKSLSTLLDAGRVLAHPFVTGELALGNLRQRAIILDALSDLPQAKVATDTEVRHFIDCHALFGRGIGHVDADIGHGGEERILVVCRPEGRRAGIGEGPTGAIAGA